MSKVRWRGGAVDRLEGRCLLAAGTAEVILSGATTVDSKGVTVDYEVKGAELGRPLTLGVYRSVDAGFSPEDTPAGSATIPVEMLDADGRPATAVGTHRVTVALAGGLPMSPSRPHVVVVADPGTAEAARPDHAASFRKETIGVIIHGGIQLRLRQDSVPPWVTKMAESLRSEGYDRVIAYNWAGESFKPGAAAKQGPRVARLIEAEAQASPPGRPVDLHVIGHSEGAVIAGLALDRLEPTPGLAAGYVELTLLDPHAASNATKSKQVSVSRGLLGVIGKGSIDAYKSKAKDPKASVPPIVDDAQVFFQRTPAALADSNRGIFNLWGQVPVAAAPGVPVHYADLTGPGISHAGAFGVTEWYQTVIVPDLGDGPAFFNPGHLTARRVAEKDAAPDRPHVEGEAAPGATLYLLASRLPDSGLLGPGLLGSSSKHVQVLGQATADATGHWAITAEASPRHDRLSVRAKVPVAPGRDHVYSSPSKALGPALESRT